MDRVATLSALHDSAPVHQPRRLTVREPGEVDQLPHLSPLHDLDLHTEADLLERFSPLDDEKLQPATRRAGGIGRAWRLLGRVVAIAIVVLAVLTIAPFGRPETGSIIAGGGSSSPFGVGSGQERTRHAVTATTATPVELTDLRRAAVPLQIDIAQIALAVDPGSLGFIEPEPDGWLEPRIEPEAQWIDGGNGVALPDLLLRIRFCESSNNYRAANVTSSARGAYQFLAKSWDWYGHAERYGVTQAHQATPAQQDEAALRTYREVGARPWAESRHCWDDPDIDEQYLTARPSATAPAPTTTAAPVETTGSTGEETTASPPPNASTTASPPANASTSTSASSTTSENPPVSAAGSSATSTTGG